MNALSVKRNVFTGDPSRLFELEPESKRRKSENVNIFKVIYLNENCFLVALKHPTTLYFQAVLDITVVAGSVQVNGYNITEGETQRAFSLSAHPALPLSTCETHFKNWNNYRNKQEQLKALGINWEDVQFIDEDSRGAIIKLTSCTQLYEPWITNFERVNINLNSNNNLKGDKIIALGGVIETWNEQNIVKKVHTNSVWTEAATEVAKVNERLMICGAQNVGKSTALHFIHNLLVKRFQKVLIFDFDPGQSEFTIPGCVSVLIVEHPLLGPNYTHLQQPLKSIYIGNLDTTKCKATYIEACDRLVRDCYSNPELRKIPWIFNTMAIFKGIGKVIFEDLFLCVKPTSLLLLSNEEGPTIINNLQSKEIPFAVKYFKCKAYGENNEKSISGNKYFKLTPSIRRFLVTNAYFTFPINFLPTELIPHTFFYDKVTFCEFQSGKVTLSSNIEPGCLVCLSKSISDNFVTEVVGFGIIRSFQSQDMVFHLLIGRNMEENLLNEIKFVVKCPVNPSLEFVSREVHGKLPYFFSSSKKLDTQLSKILL